MLRDPSLIPLSHQHHNGLALCVMIRRSLTSDSSAGNVERWARKAVDRYEIELVNHFEIEEEVLFPVCAGIPLVEELLAQHGEVRRLVEALRKAPSAALLEEFGELLTKHIRLEENELFEQAQRVVPREDLDRIGAEIDRRAVRVCL